MTDQVVGIDLGSTRCTIAIRRGGDAGAPGSTGTVAATLALGPDGSVLVGKAAERRSVVHPDLVLRDAVRRVGDRTPILLADRMLTGEEAVALLLAGVVDAVSARLGSRAGRLALAHPAGWADRTVARVLAALSAHGLVDVLPVAAPLAVAAARGARRGTAAVVEFGTDVTASVVRVTGRGRGTLIGRPVTVPHLAGVVFDDLILAQVRAALGPAWAPLDPEDARTRSAVAELRRRCRRAKELLSEAEVADVEVELPAVRARVSVGRDRFEELVAPAVAEAVAALGAALETAEVDPADLGDLVLTGGSARIPIVARTFGAALGRAAVADHAPLAALGAAALGGDVLLAHGPAPDAAPTTGPRHARRTG